MRNALTKKIYLVYLGLSTSDNNGSSNVNFREQEERRIFHFKSIFFFVSFSSGSFFLLFDEIHFSNETGSFEKFCKCFMKKFNGEEFRIVNIFYRTKINNFILEFVCQI